MSWFVWLTCFRNENTKNKTLWGQESSFSKMMVPHNLLKYCLLLYDTSLQLIQAACSASHWSTLCTLSRILPFLPSAILIFSAYSNHRQSLKVQGKLSFFKKPYLSVFQHYMISLYWTLRYFTQHNIYIYHKT